MTITISLYGVIVKPNIIKKIIALTILGDTANVLIIFLAYRLIPFPKPPILPSLKPSEEALSSFMKSSVDPLPQALVITAIVINVAVIAFLVILAIQVFKQYHTLEYDEIIKLKRGEQV
ncbi:MAG: Na+/H+ antiporter subunit C [Thermoprotei archaeon]|nr:MAG: Na+/H+ antiporter subunit C [Thermoprotei archaeon]